MGFVGSGAPSGLGASPVGFLRARIAVETWGAGQEENQIVALTSRKSTKEST